MIKKLVLLLVPIAALVAGSFGGAILRGGADDAAQAATTAGPATAAHEDAAHAAPPPPADDHAAPEAGGNGGGHGGGHGSGGDGASAAWFTFPTQFFVPLMRNGDMGAMMILTLTLETTEAQKPALEQQEHRLRDILLRQLLIAANTGTFDGNYTAEARLVPLRRDLLDAVQTATGPLVAAVLIEDIARQDR